MKIFTNLKELVKYLEGNGVYPIVDTDIDTNEPTGEIFLRNGAKMFSFTTLEKQGRLLILEDETDIVANEVNLWKYLFINTF